VLQELLPASTHSLGVAQNRKTVFAPLLALVPTFATLAHIVLRIASHILGDISIHSVVYATGAQPVLIHNVLLAGLHPLRGTSDISGGPSHKPECAAGSQTHMDGTLCRS
jgi:hypothetical protein